MQHVNLAHYGTHPAVGNVGRPQPLGGGGQVGTQHVHHHPHHHHHHQGMQQQKQPLRVHKPPPHHQQGPRVIYHPALFGPTVGGQRPIRPVPNLRPRPPGPQHEAFMFSSGSGNRSGSGGGGGGGGRAPPPHQMHQQQQQSQQSHDHFLEEQVEILHEKMEGLEGELRYAWRALDVLSQEYVKMWQRLEKMEGLLTEQQTVITQLIDLYSVESSDTANENGKTPSPLSPMVDCPGGALVALHQLAIPDENFYKALNAVHGEANADMKLSAEQSPNDVDDDSDKSVSGKIIFPPGQSPRFQGKGKGHFEGKRKSKNGIHARRRGSQGDSDDAKSAASTISTVRSEEVGEFPVPSDLSPAGYDNITPPSKPPSPPKKHAGEGGKKKKTKKQSNGKQKISSESMPPGTLPQGPLQLIGGRYSFSMIEGGTSNGKGPTTTLVELSGEDEDDRNQILGPTSLAHVTNGKPLFPSLQTAMVVSQKEAASKESKKSKKDKSKKRPKDEKQEIKKPSVKTTVSSLF